MDHKAYNKYFEEIARKHKAFRHTDERPRFFPWNEDTIIAKMSTIKWPIISAVALSGQLHDNHAESLSCFRSGGFAVLFYEERFAESYLVRQQAYQEAWEIGLSIIAKIREDERQGCSLVGLDLSQVSFSPTIRPRLNGAVGYEFKMPLKTGINLNYDESIWLQ